MESRRIVRTQPESLRMTQLPAQDQVPAAEATTEEVALRFGAGMQAFRFGAGMQPFRFGAGMQPLRFGAGMQTFRK